MAEPIQPQTPAAPTAPSGGPSPQPQGTPSATTPMQPGGGWAMPEKFRNKSAEDIARAYSELEQTTGKHANELKQMRDLLGQFQAYAETWEPHLAQLGHNPQALAALLSRAAQQASAEGHPRQAAQLQRAADKAWAEIADPYEQQEWLHSFVGNQGNQLQQVLRQELQQGMAALATWWNQYADLALQAIEASRTSNVPIAELLQDALKGATQPVSPIEMALRARSAQSPEQLREQIRKEERAKWDAEQQNKNLTTFVGSGPMAGRQSMKPLTPPPNGSTAPSRPASAPSLDAIKQKWLSDWANLVSG